MGSDGRLCVKVERLDPLDVLLLLLALEEKQVSGQRTACMLVTSGHSKRFTIPPNIHPFIHHTFTPMEESATQGDSQLARNSQGEVSRSGTLQHSRRLGGPVD